MKTICIFLLAILIPLIHAQNEDILLERASKEKRDFLNKLKTGPFWEYWKIWQECWNPEEKCFDFTNNMWLKLPTEKQIQIAKLYQTWYCSQKQIAREKRFLVKGIKIEMILVPPGKYIMGSPETESDRDDKEKQHNVKIKRPFWIGKYEVTQKQWETIMGDNPSESNQGDRYPVEKVNWKDCQKFLTKINEANFRLPSEAEWEYACRGGTTGRFNIAGDISTEQICYSGLMFYRERKETGEKNTIEVGKLKEKNSWGAYDFHGNIWEWCQDLMADYDKNPKDGRSYEKDGVNRICRGGAFNTFGSSCRSANRDSVPPEQKDKNLGFRLAKSISLKSDTEN